eukprot:COSAG06_NODE_70985_length_188_cov_99.314607_1_plen_62_part_11
MRCSRARATTPSLSLHNVIHACAAGFFSFPLARVLACVLAYGRFRYCVASLPRESAHAATLD